MRNKVAKKLRRTAENLSKGASMKQTRKLYLAMKAAYKREKRALR